MVRTVRRTRLTTVRLATARWTTGFARAFWCTTGRGACMTCIAPPPTRAPPHAQAHNFARAIRTDMLDYSLLGAVRSMSPHRQHAHLLEKSKTNS